MKRSQSGSRSEFSGFKLQIVCRLEALNVSIPVRYAKTGSEELSDVRKIITRVESENRNETNVRRSISAVCPKCQKVLSSRYFCDDCGVSISTKSLHYRGNDGDVFEKRAVKRYIELNGELKEIKGTSGLEKTEVLQVEKFLPVGELESYLIESEYEIWTDDAPDDLCAFANWMMRHDVVGLSRFSWGRDVEYRAILFPIIRKSAFVLMMQLTRNRKIFNHMMELGPQEIKEQSIVKPVHTR
jgi:hypothetical protein